MKFTGTCHNCKKEFTVERDEIPYFNSRKKRDWESFECPYCKAVNKIARFARNTNLLFALWA